MIAKISCSQQKTKFDPCTDRYMYIRILRQRAHAKAEIQADNLLITVDNLQNYLEQQCVHNMSLQLPLHSRDLSSPQEPIIKQLEHTMYQVKLLKETTHDIVATINHQALPYSSKIF